MDERIPEHITAPASSSRESASEQLRKMVSGKHNIYTLFPKDQNCDIRKKTKITKALAGNAVAQPYLEQKTSVT